MKYYSEEELAVIETFKLNEEQLIISYRNDGSMKNYDASFAATLSNLIRRGVIKRVASGDFNWVMYKLRTS